MFSVIMPVYNRADLVGDAIRSVLAQEYTDWEIVLVDDGSTDNLREVLEQFSDERIKVFHQKNGGVSVARNKAMSIAEGDYFCFLDADDKWYPNHLSVLKELIAKYPESGFFATCAQISVPNSQSVIISSDYFEGKDEDLYIENFFVAYNEDKRAKCFQMSTTCIPKSVIDRLGNFKEGCKMGEDLELSLRIAAYYPYVLTAKTTAFYNRAESVASKEGAFDPDWFFFESYKQILKDSEVSDEKKAELKKLMDWFEMRRCRHLLLKNRRKEARESYKRIKGSEELAKDRFINMILLCLPTSVIKAYFKFRWRSKA